MLDLELYAINGLALPTVDLHGIATRTEAIILLDRSLAHFSQTKNTACRVVYGVGTGVMRAAILAELRTHPLVRGVVEDGSGGSAIVGL